MPVSAVVHHTEQSVPVYNLEVAPWHTYLVSWWMFVVHNATVCLLTLARDGVKYAQDILKGNRFNKIMEKRLSEGVHELWLKGMKARLDTYIPNKKIISRKATQLAEITEETAQKYVCATGPSAAATRVRCPVCCKWWPTRRCTCRARPWPRPWTSCFCPSARAP